MAKLSRDLATPLGGGATLHTRETLIATGNLGSINAEVYCAADSSGVVALDLRGTFNLTVEVAGTLDGVNWNMIPVRPRNGGLYLLAVAGTAAGIWIGDCTGYRTVRARVTAYTSGMATATLVTEAIPFNDVMQGQVTPSTLATQAAAGAAVTLTLPAPGVGLRHYLTYLSVARVAAALLTAGAAPVSVTTTNIPGALALLFPSDAAPQGAIDRWREDFAYPLMAAAQNTATTIVCPATPNVIWRATAGFYVAP